MNYLTEYVNLCMTWPHAHAGFSFLIYHFCNKHLIMWGRDNENSSASLMFCVRWFARAMCFVPGLNLLVLMFAVFAIGTSGSGHNEADFGN